MKKANIKSPLILLLATAATLPAGAVPVLTAPLTLPVTANVIDTSCRSSVAPDNLDFSATTRQVGQSSVDPQEFIVSLQCGLIARNVDISFVAEGGGEFNDNSNQYDPNLIEELGMPPPDLSASQASTNVRGVALALKWISDITQTPEEVNYGEDTRWANITTDEGTGNHTLQGKGSLQLVPTGQHIYGGDLTMQVFINVTYI